MLSKTEAQLQFLCVKNYPLFFRASLVFFRGRDNKCLGEFYSIVDAKGHNSNRGMTLLNVVCSTRFLYPFSCVGVLLLLFRLSGFPILAHYTAPFLERTGMKVDYLLISLINGIVRFACSLLALMFLPMMSKRISFMIFGGLGTLGMLTSK